MSFSISMQKLTGFVETVVKNAQGHPRCNHWDPNIVVISGALFALSLSILTLNFQYEEDARVINNI